MRATVHILSLLVVLIVAMTVVEAGVLLQEELYLGSLTHDGTYICRWWLIVRANFCVYISNVFACVNHVIFFQVIFLLATKDQDSLLHSCQTQLR